MTIVVGRRSAAAREDERSRERLRANRSALPSGFPGVAPASHGGRTGQLSRTRGGSTGLEPRATRGCRRWSFRWAVLGSKRPARYGSGASGARACPAVAQGIRSGCYLVTGWRSTAPRTDGSLFKPSYNDHERRTERRFLNRSVRLLHVLIGADAVDHAFVIALKEACPQVHQGLRLPSTEMAAVLLRPRK